MTSRDARCAKCSCLGFLTLLFISSSLAQTRPTPTAVVKQYCKFDFETGRISSANFSKLPSLVTWPEEPGWDTVTVVSGFKILSSKQFPEHAVVTVKWEILGHSEGENVTSDEKAEVVNYQLTLINGSWKIEAPVLPPHVALPTLRAFVLKQFSSEPKRQKLWVRNLDALLQKSDPLKKLTSEFPGSAKLKENGRLLEFCPDNTCDGFVVAGTASIATLKDFAYLYEFFFSDFVVLDGWRTNQEAKDSAQQVLSKEEYSSCKRDNEHEAARCVLRDLSRGRAIRLIFIRYDEGARNVVPRDITEELAEQPTSKSN